MKPKVFILSLGCPRNLVDSEVLVGGLRKNGFIITEDVHKADVFIVNTCAFIDKAKQESIDTILDLAALKSENNSRRLIVAGCLPQRYPNELREEIPEIDGVFGCSDFGKIPDFLKKASFSKRTNVTSVPRFLYDHKLDRELITPSHYAYIKLQEGCMNYCSYCVIPRLRGPYRSRSMRSVMLEARHLRDGLSVKEINLIGQDTTLYGIDRYGKTRIAELVRKIAPIMKGRWVRLLYTHPKSFPHELIGVIRDEPSVCKYVDLPIQHINDTILKRMNRGVTKKHIISLIEKIRKEIPDVAIRTSVIVGFPGETHDEFKELLRFVQDMKFERLGAFTYSREEGTKAYAFEGQVDEKEKGSRFDVILKAQQEISRRYNEGLKGRVLTVIIDEKSLDEKNVYLARTEKDAPDVDGMCYVKSKKVFKNGDFVKVRITDTLEYDLVGEAV